MKKIFFVFLFALTAITSQGQNVVHRMDTVYLCKVDILDLILQYSKLDSIKQPGTEMNLSSHYRMINLRL